MPDSITAEYENREYFLEVVQPQVEAFMRDNAAKQHNLTMQECADILNLPWFLEVQAS